MRAAKSAGTMVVTLVVSSFIVFAALYAAPGDPLTFLLGGPENRTPERIAAVTEQYHLNEPFLTRYWLWASGVLRGDLGASMQYHQPVAALVASRFPVTVFLALYSSILVVIIGIGLGIVAAVKRSSRTDRLIVGGTTLGASVPTFAVGLFLVTVFALWLRIFPAAGAGDGFIDRLWHLTLPAISLAIGAIAIVSRVTRQSMVEMFESDHVAAARGTGLSESLVVRRHVLRNSWGPIVTMVGLVVAGLLSGTVVIESVFGISGVGKLLVDAINTHDFPVVQAVVLFMVFTYMVIMTAVDLVLPLFDARLSRVRA